MSQIAAHAAYGGVVPEIAARAHVEIDRQPRRARAAATPKLAAARPRRRRRRGGAGPDRRRAGRPDDRQGRRAGGGQAVLAVNHLEAHALTARLDAAIWRFPICCCSPPAATPRFSAVKGVGDYDRLGATMDDAIGEAFDKTAKMLGLPLSRRSRGRGARPRRAIPTASRCPARCSGGRTRIFRLSGLKTATRQAAETHRAAAAPRRRRSLRLVSGGGRRRDRGPHARRPAAVSSTRRRGRRRW